MLSALLIFNEMAARKHALMKNSANEDVSAVKPVENHMFLMLETAISTSDLLTSSSKFGRLGKLATANLQFIYIAESLS